MSSYNIKNKNDIISISGLSFTDKTAVEYGDVTNKNEFILAEDVNEIKRAVNDTLSGISLFSKTVSDDLSSLQSKSITLNQSINDLSEQISNIQSINNIKLSQLNTAIIQNSGNITNLSLSTEQLKNDLISTQSTYAEKTAITYLQSEIDILSTQYERTNLSLNSVDTLLSGKLTEISGKIDAIQSYDDSQLVNDIGFISGKISPLESKTLKNAMNIDELSGKVQNFQNYDDTQIRNKINANESNIYSLSSQVQAIQASGYDDSALVERISNVENVQTQVKTDIINANNRITINYLELTGKLSSLTERFDNHLNVQSEINDKISYLSSAIDAVSEQGYNDTELRGRIETLEQIHSEDFSQFVTVVNELSGKLKNL